MTRTITIPDSAVPAEQARVDQYNVGSGQPPVTIEQFAQIERDEITSQRVAEYHTAARSAMTPIADALISAPSSVRDKILSDAVAELKKQGLL